VLALDQSRQEVRCRSLPERRRSAGYISCVAALLPAAPPRPGGRALGGQLGGAVRLIPPCGSLKYSF
jgi:hypothetical protein